jgi:multiple sugar transport system permease protein
MLVLIVATFIIPAQITSIPRYVLFDNYGMLDTVFPFYLTAMFGQGIRSAIFILVFYQFFSSYPVSFDEAAELDGAGKCKTFLRISLPMASMAIVLSLLLSFVWYWNETTESNMLFGSSMKTLPLQLANFTARYEAIYGAADQASTANRLNESVTLAGTLLSIIPLLVLYICLQRRFIESIERTGITGE